MSVEMSVNIEGLTELRVKLERLDDGMKEHVHYVLASEGEKIKTTAQSLCPTRTGYLRSTIFARIEDWVLRVGASAHYAVYVELGTRLMKAGSDQFIFHIQKTTGLVAELFYLQHQEHGIVQWWLSLAFSESEQPIGCITQEGTGRGVPLPE